MIRKIRMGALLVKIKSNCNCCLWEIQIVLFLCPFFGLERLSIV